MCSTFFCCWEGRSGWLLSLSRKHKYAFFLLAKQNRSWCTFFSVVCTQCAGQMMSLKLCCRCVQVFILKAFPLLLLITDLWMWELIDFSLIPVPSHPPIVATFFLLNWTVGSISFPTPTFLTSTHLSHILV